MAYEEDPLTESLLEMHFHRALLALFEEIYGARVLKIYKPSTNREAWLGYDQAWVRTVLSQREFEDYLIDSLHHGGTPERFVGYYLQFKRVERMARRSRFAPVGFPDTYCRAEISTKVNPNTGISQHETLLRLQHLEASDVNYACPMVFGPDALYETPDLDQLRLVPVRGAPAYSDADRHFIAFRDPTDVAPVWCSEPIVTKSVSPAQWMYSDTGPRRVAGQDAVGMIRQFRAVMTLRGRPPAEQGSTQAFTVLEFEDTCA